MLLIDDDPEVHESLAAGLQADNLRLLCARNGEAAMQLARQETVHAILLDLGLPGQDGFAILKESQRDARLRNVPVIIVTASGSTADKLRGFELGASDYISKPYELAELRARLKGFSAPSCSRMKSPPPTATWSRRVRRPRGPTAPSRSSWPT